MLARLTLAWIGTGYVGWQRQPNGPSVQAALEAALAELAREAVAATGASRTDAGVHAHAQTVHCHLSQPLPLRALVHGTNHFLPPEIRVLDAALAPEGFHAQRSATAKLYRYRLSLAEVVSPFAAPFVWALRPPLDLVAMRAATRSLLGRHDFSAFALAGGSHRQSWRTLFAADWEEQGAELVFTVVGDAFLRGMVRGLVGTLVEVGRGRRAVASVARLLAGAPRAAAGETAPAAGLCLERVYYPERFGGPIWSEPAPANDLRLS